MKSTDQAISMKVVEPQHAYDSRSGEENTGVYNITSRLFTQSLLGRA